MNPAHPRDTGNFSRGMYEMKNRGFGLMESLRKITLDPANFIAFANPDYQYRGRLHADITIFDYDEIDHGGTVQNPGVPSKGIQTVIVNGTVVYRDRVIRDVAPGLLIKRVSE